MSQVQEPLSCPLCSHKESAPTFTQGSRIFYECLHCDLLFVDPASALSHEEEKKRYDAHRNSFDDAGYRAFLSKLSIPLLSCLAPGSYGLDFGSGPSDALARLFKDEGHIMDRYDPYYAPLTPQERAPYDFLVCSEVVEHFRRPFVEFELIRGLVRKGGWIGIMTNLRDSHRGDSSWWYLRDATHLCFYSERSFRWIADTLQLRIESTRDNVILMQRE